MELNSAPSGKSVSTIENKEHANELTPDELRICKLTGTDPKEYLKFKKGLK